jgi:hypothetical protein
MAQEKPEKTEDINQKPTTAEDFGPSSYIFQAPTIIRELIKAKAEAEMQTPLLDEAMEKRVKQFRSAMENFGKEAKNSDDADILKLLSNVSNRVCLSTMRLGDSGVYAVETMEKVIGSICLMPPRHEQLMTQKTSAYYNAEQKIVFIRPEPISNKIAATFSAFALMLLQQQAIQKETVRGGSDKYYQNFVNAYLAELIVLDHLSTKKLKEYSRAIIRKYGFNSPDELVTLNSKPNFTNMVKDFNKTFFDCPPLSSMDRSSQNSIFIFALAFELTTHIAEGREAIMQENIKFLRKLDKSTIK